MKNFSLSIYGNLIYDQILYLKNFPKQGVAEKVDKINYRVGASANVARAYFHITKTKPTIVSNIGLDENYERIIEEVSRYSLPSFTKVEGKNSSAMILSNLSNSSRTGLVYWGSCLNLSNFFLGGGNSKSKNDNLYKFKEKMANMKHQYYIGKKIHNHDIYEFIIKKWENKFPNLKKMYKNHLLKYNNKV